MYSIKLINILQAIPEITSNNLSSIDNFLGKVGTEKIFSKNDLLGVITQKLLFDKIINYLLSESIIVPYEQKCPMCGNRLIYQSDYCDNCHSVVDIEESINRYKIKEKLYLSPAEEEALHYRALSLDLAGFRLLLEKIERKKRKKKEAYIVFFDLANSAKLLGKEKYTHSFICQNMASYIKQTMNNYLRMSEGIIVKSDGDSSYAYLDNIEAVKLFLNDFIENLEHQEFYGKIEGFNKDSNDFKLYIKIFIANSGILEYHQTDLLSIDFDSMEAFQFINRIEKDTKGEILKANSTENELIPFFVISREDIFSSNILHLNGIKDYGTVDVFFTKYQELLQSLKFSMSTAIT